MAMVRASVLASRLGVSRSTAPPTSLSHLLWSQDPIDFTQLECLVLDGVDTYHHSLQQESSNPLVVE